MRAATSEGKKRSLVWSASLIMVALSACGSSSHQSFAACTAQAKNAMNAADNNLFPGIAYTWRLQYTEDYNKAVDEYNACPGVIVPLAKRDLPEPTITTLTTLPVLGRTPYP